MKAKLFIFLFLIVGTSTLSTAQLSSNKGKEFWVGYMAHVDANAGLYLYITSDSSTSGTVSIPGKNWSKSFTVTQNAMTLVAVPPSLAHVTCSDCVTDQGIKVVSAKPIVVYSHIYYNYRSDATLVLPVNTTGQEYYCMSYEQGKSSDRSEFIIAANKDNTKINITPTVDLRSSSNTRIPAKKTYTITLNEGQVYQAKAFTGNMADDVTGTHIQVIDTGKSASCKTVSVFSGSSWTSLGCNNSADNLYEQMYPVQSWGSRFVTVPLKDVNYDNLRFMAALDSTYVLILNSSGAPTVFYIDAGEYYDLKDVTEAKYVIADKPITVAQYSKTQACAGKISDPSMTILNPVEQTLTEISLYSSKYEAITKHYINIVIPSRAKNSFRIDGNPASFTDLKKFPFYAYAQIDVSSGTHYLKADEGFNATAYGYGTYESYGYAAGANLKILKTKIELLNSSLNNSDNICLGNEARFKGSSQYDVRKWEWYFGDGEMDTSQNISHIYKDTGLYRVKLLTYKSIFDGCKSFDSTILMVRVSGVPKAKYSHSLNCEGEVFFIDHSITPANEKIDLVFWEFQSGNTEYSALVSKTYDTSGVFGFKQIIRTENWCYDTLIDSILINPKPIVGFSANKTCQLDSTHFMNTSSIVSGTINSYQWYLGDGDSSKSHSPVHLYNNPGFYKVSLMAISDSLCSAIYEDSVFKYKNVKVDFNFKDTCAGLPFQITNLTDTNSLKVSDILWTSSEGDSVKTYHFNKTFYNPGKVNITLSLKLDSFCMDSMVKEIEIYPVPQTKFTYSSVCANDTILFTNTSNISSGFVNTYSWDVDDSKLHYTNEFKVKYNQAGYKKIKLISISDKGCLDEIRDTILIRSIALNSFVFKDTCQNTEQIVKAKYTAVFDTIVSWQWAFDASNYLGDSTLKINSVSAGKKEIILSVISQNGCKDKWIDSVQIFENPFAAFTAKPVCAMADISPINTSSIGANSSIVQYQWFIDNTPISNLFEPKIAALSSPGYNIKLDLLSDKGCKDTVTHFIEVYDLPKVDFVTSDTCLGQLTQFKDNSSIGTGSLFDFSWRFHDLSKTNGSSVSKMYPAVSFYQVTHTVTSDKFCSDSIIKDVEICPLPQIDIVPVNISGCEPFEPEFLNNSNIVSGAINKYTWYWGDGGFSDGKLPNHTYANYGSYQIKVTALSDKGCVDSISLNDKVIVNENPVADFSFSPLNPSILESTVDFMDLSSNDVQSWEWSFGDGTFDISQNTNHTYLDTGKYTIQLKVTNDSGCIDFAYKSFFINPDIFIFIPNSFSPNKDFVNDSFGVEGVVNGIKKFQISIYNRWGEMVYTSSDPHLRWDGTSLGKEVQQGSYIYFIQFQDFKGTRWYSKKGMIQLIR